MESGVTEKKNAFLAYDSISLRKRSMFGLTIKVHKPQCQESLSLCVWPRHLSF